MGRIMTSSALRNTTFYYVYRITRTDTNEYYIGRRTSKPQRRKGQIYAVRPSEDFGVRYFTSGIWRRAFKQDPKQFTWDILSQHATNQEASCEELRLIRQYQYDPQCVNGQLYRQGHPPISLCERFRNNTEGVIFINGNVVFSTKDSQWQNVADATIITELSRINTQINDILAKETV